jgi:hypothetical protein
MVFLFTLFPVYFRRITIPALWVFPLLYFSNDIIALASGVEDSVAHAAHVGGLVTGMLLTWFFTQDTRLEPGSLFPEEQTLVRNIMGAQSPRALALNFCEAMEWNWQNPKSLELFLARARELGFPPQEQKLQASVERHLARGFERIFRRESPGRILNWLERLPMTLGLRSSLKKIPPRRLLALADQSARERRWPLALRLYEASLEQKLPQETVLKIKEALDYIRNLNQESSA